MRRTSTRIRVKPRAMAPAVEMLGIVFCSNTSPLALIFDICLRLNKPMATMSRATMLNSSIARRENLQVS